MGEQSHKKSMQVQNVPFLPKRYNEQVGCTVQGAPPSPRVLFLSP